MMDGKRVMNEEDKRRTENSIYLPLPVVLTIDEYNFLSLFSLFRTLFLYLGHRHAGRLGAGL